MATTFDVPGRTGSAYRALPVLWPMRLRLLWAARTDRRAGLPVGVSRYSTPVLRALVARRDDVCERERTLFLTDVERIDVRLAETAAEVAALDRLLPQRRDAVLALAAPLDEDALDRRRAGEEHASDELVRQRRAAERQRARTAATAALEEVRTATDALLAERADLQARRRHRADVARSRALRYCEHTDRLAALYRRALVRRHPQREALISQWHTELAPPPAWVCADDPAPTTTGAAA